MPKVLLPVIVILAIAFAALWTVKKSLKPEEGSPHSQAEVAKGTKLPEFTLREFGGSDVSLQKFDGKLLVINFWATWCEACVVEMPSLVGLREKFHARGLELIFVSLDENPTSTLPSVLNKLKIDFPTYVDHDQKLSELFDIHGIPMTLIVDRKREILEVVHGERDWSTTEALSQFEKWL